MPYFRVDDQFYLHPKVEDAPNYALGLWVRIGSYCAAHKTDGKILKKTAQKFGKPREFSALLECGLIQDDDKWWLMPDYLDHNYSATEVEETRRKSRERQRKHREKKADEQGDTTKNVTRDSRALAKPSQAKPTLDSDLTAAVAKPVSEQGEPLPQLTIEDLPPVAVAAIELYTAKRVLDKNPENRVPYAVSVRNGTVKQNGARMIEQIEANPKITPNELCFGHFKMGPVDLFNALEALSAQGVRLPVEVTP